MAIIQQRSGDLVYLVDENIHVPHAFTTRQGGVSTGVYESLNLGMNRGDDPGAVAENFDRITAALGTTRGSLVFSKQVHGDTVRVVTGADRIGDLFDNDLPEADGLITAEGDLPLMVFTADCIPILLWDAGTGAVGAVHAGWRSTVLDIAGKAVGRMVRAYGTDPAQIRAAIGPGIGPCCFETGPEVPAAVRASGEEAFSTCITAGDDGRSFVDLQAVNRGLLLRAGVLGAHISTAAVCTMCEPETYWSHRATAGVRGSQGAIIVSRGLGVR